MRINTMTQHRTANGAHAAISTTRDDVYLTDLLVSTFNVRRVTEHALLEEEDGYTKRGQNLDMCPTDLLPLHGNVAPDEVKVSGDLVIAADSCPVKIHFAPGDGGAAVFQPGTNVGVTFPVAGKYVLSGQCVDMEGEGGETKRCAWTFTRTSP